MNYKKFEELPCWDILSVLVEKFNPNYIVLSIVIILKKLNLMKCMISWVNAANK